MLKGKDYNKVVNCACGCGSKIRLRDRSAERRKTLMFIHGHNSRLPQPSKRRHLCKCGCGGYPGRSRKYIEGHCKIKFSRLHRSRISKARKMLFKKGILRIPKGKNHPSWKGGRTKLRILIGQLPEYIRWRKRVFKRDKYTCRLCFAKRIKGDRVVLQAHHLIPVWKLLNRFHIKTVEDAKKCRLLWSTKIGLTVCLKCHRLETSKK